MIIALYVAAAVIMAVGSLYLAWRNRDVRNFLAGAFFVSSGTLFYLLSRQCFGSTFGDRFCRNTSDQRWPFHRPFHSSLLLCFYFGFVKEAKGTASSYRETLAKKDRRATGGKSQDEQMLSGLPSIAIDGADILDGQLGAETGKLAFFAGRSGLLRLWRPINRHIQSARLCANHV